MLCMYSYLPVTILVANYMPTICNYCNSGTFLGQLPVSHIRNWSLYGERYGFIIYRARLECISAMLVLLGVEEAGWSSVCLIQ